MPTKNTTSDILVFDIETNGLLNQLDRVHCGVILDYKTKEVQEFRPWQIDALADIIHDQVVVAHNGIGFDAVVMEELYEAKPKMVIDTLVMSRVLNPDRERPQGLPQRVGPHGLEAWGYRLGFYKGEYGKQENAWDEYSEEMLQYCKQDVMLTAKVYEALLKEMEG